MARAPTTLDPFNALAESKRRQVLGTLALGGGELPVNSMVESLGWPQPQVSKHLSVLLQVGLVSVRRQGRERYYRLEAAKIKTVHDWTRTFERFWDDQLDRIKRRAESKDRGKAAPNGPDRR